MSRIEAIFIWMLNEAVPLLGVALLVVLIVLVLFIYFKTRDEIPHLRYLLETGYYSREFGPRGFPVYEDRIFLIISNAERRNDLRLSWGARSMLAVPIIELSQRGSIDWGEVERSVEMIVSVMREDYSEASLVRGETRNAISVIRAFFKKFCNIPPFCASDEEVRR